MREIHVIEEYSRNDRRKMVVHDTEIPTPEASLAMVLLEKWGMVAASPDGEDSTGRQKLELLTPKNVVKRAFDVAEEAFSEMRRRGMFVLGPSGTELYGKVNDDD